MRNKGGEVVVVGAAVVMERGESSRRWSGVVVRLSEQMEEATGLLGQSAPMPVGMSQEGQITFVLALGEALHRYGTPAHRLEDALGAVSERFGLKGQFFSTPTSITAAFGELGRQSTHLLRVQPGSIDLRRLAEVDEIAGEVIRGELDIEQGLERIEQVRLAPRLYPVWSALLAYVLVAASAARFFQGSWREIALAAMLGLAVGGLCIVMAKQRDSGWVLEPVAACLVATLAAAGGLLLAPVSISIATIAGLISLMPGFSLTVAMTELATRNLVSGTARLMGAMLVLVELGFGVALGQKLSSWLELGEAAPSAGPVYVWTEGVALLVATLGFAALFEARRKDLKWFIFAGVLGYLSGRAGVALLGAELGAFAGALVVGSISNAFARWLDRPATILLVPGIILLVPGSIGFRSMTALIEHDVIGGVGTAFTMILIASALVAGLLFANVLVSPRRAL
jgi:uncharacterized membrane protein YjjP (DUF1212 family)